MHKEVKCRSILLDIGLVVGSFVLAFGVVTRNEAEKRVSLFLGVFLVVAGVVFFTRITHLLNKLIFCTSGGVRFIKHFNLSLSDCLDITNK